MRLYLHVLEVKTSGLEAVRGHGEAGETTIWENVCKITSPTLATVSGNEVTAQPERTLGGATVPNRFQEDADRWKDGNVENGE